jgi:anti-sigma B factor antagonist
MTEEARPLQVQAKETSGRAVVHVAGDVDLRSSPQLRDQLLELARDADGDLLVDLSEVSYMDSSGVGTMVFVKREVEKSGGRMVLIRLQPRVRSVFEITHLTKFFKIVESLDEVPPR